MNVVREVEKVLSIQEPQKKLDAIIGPLDRLFERGRALPVRPERLGKAASLLLTAALEEQDVEIKEEMFAVLLTAVAWNEISRYIDWIALVDHLPCLSGYTLGYALRALGRSRRHVFLAILQDYLRKPDIFIQVEALDAMIQIWWETSGKDAALKTAMQVAALTEVQAMLLNPYKYTTPRGVVHERFALLCTEVVKDMKDWFKQQKHYEF
jgi:hypothetical protein